MLKKISYLIIILVFQFVVYAGNDESEIINNGWEFSLAQGDTAEAIKILLSSDDTSYVKRAQYILLDQYNRYSAKNKIFMPDYIYYGLQSACIMLG